MTRAVIYTRISQSNDDSVAIPGQIKKATEYAALYDWEVVGTFVDDGVSASYNRPEDRAGWRALMESQETFDVVIVLKVDRLARKLTDFWETYKELEKRGAVLVSVNDRLDMTTALGRTFAGIIAGFAEVEAETISKRVADARRYLLGVGRAGGGRVPYGWRTFPNPDGAGKVVRRDPERIEWVRGMVERAQRGDTVYSIVKWLNDERVRPPEAPRGTAATSKQDGGEVVGRKDLSTLLEDGEDGSWAYTTLRDLLLHPILAGMTVYNPGNKNRRRGTEVVRGKDGLAVVDESIAIMTQAEWYAMVERIKNPGSPQSKPRGLWASTSALLSGLLWCDDPRHDEPIRMYRRPIQGNDGFYCKTCHQSISRAESVIVDEFLRKRGPLPRGLIIEEVYEGGAAVLPEIEHRIRELTGKLAETDDDDEADRLNAELRQMRTQRREQRAKAPQVVQRAVTAPGTFAEAWADADSTEERRAVLDDALVRVLIRRGARGGPQTDAAKLARMEFEWTNPLETGPIELPDDETLAAWADDA